MRIVRPAIAIEGLRHLRAPMFPGQGARVHPRFFGRRMPGFILGGADDDAGWAISDDLKLFATAFAVGFLFVSVLIF